jgi:hypothetical protein
MQRLQVREQKIHQEIIALHSECPHADLVSKPGANTGNWDMYSDSYWVDYHCQDCDRRWRVYS